MISKKDVQIVCDAYMNAHEESMTAEKCVEWIMRWGVNLDAHGYKWYCLKQAHIADIMRQEHLRFWTDVENTPGTGAASAARMVRDAYEEWAKANNPGVDPYAVYIWDHRNILPGAHDAIGAWMMSRIEDYSASFHEFMGSLQ